MRRQIDQFNEHKEELANLKSRFEELYAISNEVDQRMKTMTSASDSLQNYEVKMRNIAEGLTSLETKYNRLDQKNETLDRVIKDVDTVFGNIKDLESKLRDCSRQTESLPNEIRDVQTKVDRILQNGPKITEAVGKLDSLEESLNSTEKKFEELSAMSGSLKKTEIRLSQMDSEIGKKFDTLHDIARNDVKEKGTIGGVVSPKDREKVKILATQGWRPEEISTRTHIPMEAIDLILSTPDNL